MHRRGISFWWIIGIYFIELCAICKKFLWIFLINPILKIHWKIIESYIIFKNKLKTLKDPKPHRGRSDGWTNNYNVVYGRPHSRKFNVFSIHLLYNETIFMMVVQNIVRLCAHFQSWSSFGWKLRLHKPLQCLYGN